MTTKNYITAGLLTAAIVALGLPAISQAAMYAYVDNTGDVKAVIANDWMTAIEIAPNRYAHSGVLLLNSLADQGILGDQVRGF